MEIFDRFSLILKEFFGYPRDASTQTNLQFSGSIVKLNVGGTVFQTKKSTLANHYGFFKTMLKTSVPEIKDSSDCMFIDRSPKHFEKILNYIRDGEVDLPESAEDVNEIRNEAQYYLLDGLVELCKPKSGVKYIEDGDQNLINAFVNCNKKAVIIITYRSDTDINGVEKLAAIVNRYGGEFDVYLSRKPTISADFHCWTYLVYDKMSGASNNNYLPALDEWMMSIYGFYN